MSDRGKIKGIIEIDALYGIDFEDDYDDIYYDNGMWISEEREIQKEQNIEVPEYTWDLYDKVKRKTWWSDDNEENNE